MKITSVEIKKVSAGNEFMWKAIVTFEEGGSIEILRQDFADAEAFVTDTIARYGTC